MFPKPGYVSRAALPTNTWTILNVATDTKLGGELLFRDWSDGQWANIKYVYIVCECIELMELEVIGSETGFMKPCFCFLTLWHRPFFVTAPQNPNTLRYRLPASVT